MTAQFGYMELPSIEPVLAACAGSGLHLEGDETSFFYADPKLVRAKTGALPGWQRAYFDFLTRNAHPLPDDLGIRSDWRVEIGVDVAL